MKKVTKDDLVRSMMIKALAISGKNADNYTRDAENEIWSICSDWNSEHEGSEEIFMCEHEDEETGYVDGFYIEYDYFITGLH